MRPIKEHLTDISNLGCSIMVDNMVIIDEMRLAKYAFSIFRIETRQTDSVMQPAQVIIYMAHCAIEYDSKTSRVLCLDTNPPGHD